MQGTEDTELVEVVVSCSRYDLNSDSPVEVPFSGRYLGNQGAYKAALILARTPAIKKVNLSNNGIGDFGLLGFFRLLKNKAVASFFDFSDNNITDSSIGKVVSFLNANRSVVTFDLSKNKLSDLQALESGLIKNYSIMELGLKSEELNRILLRNITHCKQVIQFCLAYKAGTVLKLSKDLVKSINAFGVEAARSMLVSEAGFSISDANDTLKQLISLCKDMRSSNGISINAAIAASSEKRQHERVE